MKGFIENLCENKERPELKCNGKCFLAKVIESKKQEKSESLPIINWEEFSFFINPITEKNTLILSEVVFHQYFFIDLMENHREKDIFHPPKNLLV